MTTICIQPEPNEVIKVEVDRHDDCREFYVLRITDDVKFFLSGEQLISVKRELEQSVIGVINNG